MGRKDSRSMINQGEVSAFGPWLAWVMQEKSATATWLSNRSGVNEETIYSLIVGEIRPEDVEEDVYKIGEALMTYQEPARERMDRVLETLSAHNDLRRWRATCDGGCCPWNSAID
jgi:hypothetical protein